MLSIVVCIRAEVRECSAALTHIVLEAAADGNVSDYMPATELPQQRPPEKALCIVCPEHRVYRRSSSHRYSRRLPGTEQEGAESHNWVPHSYSHT